MVEPWVKIDKNPSNTLKQQVQRLKMTYLGKLSSHLYEVIEMGGPSRPVRFTPGNAFVSANKNTISVDEQLNATIDYEQLAVSKGVLRAPEVAAVTSDAEAHTLLFSYEEEEFGRQAVATDVMYAFVLEKQKMCSKVFRLDTRAESSQPQVDVPAKWEMASLATYLSLLSADGRKASGSLFLPIG